MKNLAILSVILSSLFVVSCADDEDINLPIGEEKVLKEDINSRVSGETIQMPAR